MSGGGLLNLDVGKGSHGGGVSYERWNNVPSILPCPFFRNFIFTEHRDTLIYLTDRIRTLLGKQEAVIEIHGGTKREDRCKAQELFRNDPETRVLVATDAAGEGVNLQNANLMVNYDLPWNPNRLEQRFGRIHRIGQKQICHLWNLLAGETAEGHVFQTLFNKLEIERKALGGRVYDILGKVFQGVSLKDVLVEAIRYGDDPEVLARQDEKVSGALDTSNLQKLIDNDALCEQIFSEKQLFQVKEEMDKAEARKLQPYFIRAFFQKAFAQLGGDLKPREPGRFEISHVPGIIRERDRVLSGRNRANRNPVVLKYERICFEKKEIDLRNKPKASLIHPGHPLMQSLVDLILEQSRNHLKQGAVLLDPNDAGETPRMMFLIDQAVKDGNDDDGKRTLSRRIQFVEITPDGKATFAGWGPHLDYEALDEHQQLLVQELLQQPWLTQNLEQLALNYASTQLVPEHYSEIKELREHLVEKTLAAVHERLAKEIGYWEDRYIKLKEDMEAGKQPRMQPENARRTMDELVARLKQRTKELNAMRHVVSATPIIVGGALIIPAGFLAKQQGKPAPPVDVLARLRVEQLAMQAVLLAEEALGHTVTDVSADKVGWDITSRPGRQCLPDGRMVLPLERHIEVKGRQKDGSIITVSRNEILYGLNQKEKFILALVLVDGDTTEGPFYIHQPFSKEPEDFAASVNLELDELLSRAVAPHECPLILPEIN
ncbi:MAG: DUF3883 domain-containing protein [Vampirovibrio sp.]|nr:DUF3883 domain-containing protein [Vampirovibrio sp.]